MKKIQISPSILSADFSQLGNEIKKLEEGGADMIHVDVMDGHFVPNLTIGPPVIKALKKHSSILFDVHLMISPVHKYIEAYSDAGADIITFLAPAEICVDDSDFDAKKPVHSSTMSTDNFFHGKLDGSLSLKTKISSELSTIILFFSDLTSNLNFP